MIRLELIEFIRITISSFLGCIPLITFVGYFKAWLANKFGDSTAKDNGFLTFDPFVHLNFIGLILLMIPPYLGFSNIVPVDLENIKEPNRTFKILLLNFSRSIAYFILLILLLFCAAFLIWFTNISALNSLNTALLLIFRIMISFSCFTMVFNFFMATVDSFVYFYLPEYRNNLDFVNLVLVLPLMFYFIYSNLIGKISYLLLTSIVKLLS